MDETALEAKTPAGGTATWPLTLTVLLVYALVAAAAFQPQWRLWGVNHLSCYPVPVRAVALVLIGLTFLPPLARRLYGAMLDVSRTIETGGTRLDLVLAALTVASVVLFWSLRTSNNLLGDGQLIAQSFEAAWKGHERVIMRSAEAIVTEERIAPGTTLMYYGAARAITSVVDRTPVWAIRLFICWLGALLVYLVLAIARRGSFSPEIRLWFLVLVMFSAVLQMYFGYIENYAPLFFFGLLYVLSGFIVMHRGAGLWAAIVLFVVTAYTHIQGVLLFPSLVYLILWHAMKKRRRQVERYAGPALTAATVAGVIAAGFTRIGEFYLPLRGGKWFYGMFSANHFLDVGNELMMMMPSLPLFVAMAWINRSPARRAARGRDKRAGVGTSPPWFTLKAEWHFAILLLVPCLLYLFLFKSEIGMARDWDLFTITMLGLVPLALLVVNRFFLNTRMCSSAATFTLPAVALHVALAVAWIGVNASPIRSAERFERILEYDKTHAAYAYENLAIFYHDRGMLEKATEIMEMTCEFSNNPRQYVRLAIYYVEQGRKTDAIELMRRVVREHPHSHRPRFYLTTLIADSGDPEELWELAREGTKYHPEEPIYWFYYGEIAINKGMIDEGVAALRTCLSLNPPAQARERCLEQIEKYAGSGQGE